jgi:ACR3 family arsenite transporter
MSLFERYLSLWVALCMFAGAVLGSLLPGVFSVIANIEFAQVNLIVAIFIWVMVYPMMTQIDFASIINVRQHPKGLILTLVVNWLIKPFTMAALAWLFFKVIYSSWIDSSLANEYIAGMILLGTAPCTAMVFVWSQLTKGDPNYTLVQVTINDLIMIVAFAPIAAFLLGINDIQVPWETLLLSVLLYIFLPLIAGVYTRKKLNASADKKQLTIFLNRLKPWSILGLLATVTLLFAFQAKTILAKPQTILLIAIPLLLQSYGVFMIAYVAAKALKLPRSIAAPACMIGTSNFFELAVAVAISLFGLHSGAALATVVGVLVEVPVMLSLVMFINRKKYWLTKEGY